jgi:hypothetical protein
MNPLSLIKTAVEITVSVGVGAVVGNAIKASTPANVLVVKRVAIGVGAFVLSSMVGDMATKYATDTIDDTAGKIKKFMKPEVVEEIELAPEVVE